MLTLFESKKGSVVVTALISLLAIYSATYWLQHLAAKPDSPASAPMLEAVVLIDSINVARMLGTKNPTAVVQASLASRFVLRGVLAGPLNGGAALISVDSKPAQPVRVGGIVAENLVLKSVAGRTAVVGAEGSDSALILIPNKIVNNMISQTDGDDDG